MYMNSFSTFSRLNHASCVYINLTFFYTFAYSIDISKAISTSFVQAGNITKKETDK